jgi:hypothetical protein
VQHRPTTPDSPVVTPVGRGSGDVRSQAHLLDSIHPHHTFSLHRPFLGRLRLRLPDSYAATPVGPNLVTWQRDSTDPNNFTMVVVSQVRSPSISCAPLP